MKKRLKTMSWPSRFLFLLMGLTISIILTAHSMYIDQANQKATLKQITSPIVKPVTKQELRTFLESISPLILDQIDTKEKVIGVWLGNRGEDKLLDLSERPGFDNLISIKRGNKGWIMPSCIERG